MLSKDDFNRIFAEYSDRYILHSLKPNIYNYSFVNALYIHGLEIELWQFRVSDMTTMPNLIISFRHVKNPALWHDEHVYIFTWPENEKCFDEFVDLYDNKTDCEIEVIKKLMNIVTKGKDIGSIYGLK